MRTWWIPAALAGLLLGCGGGGDEDPGDEMEMEAAQDVAPSGNDPCALVSQAEMEQLMGPLAEAPYRVRNRRPDPGGDGCFYRARDRRNVTLIVDFEDGPLGFRMMAGMGGGVEDLLGGRDMSADTLEAPWDEVAFPFGQLIALKGNASVQVDPLGSRLDVGQMAQVITWALGRLDSPLRYDGARATRNRKDDPPLSGDPCSLVTPAEAEELMGPLAGDPYPAEEGSGCVFPLDKEMMGERVRRTLEVQWSDGFYALGQERQALGMAGNAMASFMGDEDMPALGETGVGEGEPWDEQVTLLGGVVTVVRDDVLLRMGGEGMFGFGEEQALSLLRKAVARLN